MDMMGGNRAVLWTCQRNSRHILSDQTFDVIAVVQRMISRDKARARLSESDQ